MLRCGRCRTEEYSRQLIYSQITNAQRSVYEYFLCAGRPAGRDVQSTPPPHRAVDVSNQGVSPRRCWQRKRHRASARCL
jgi:hypothetical protein